MNITSANDSSTLCGTGTIVYPYGSPETISIDVTPDHVWIVKRAHPNFSYTVIGPNSQPPDKVWKEVWEVEGGKLVRRPDVVGTHTPAQSIPESFEFDEPDQRQGEGV